MSAAGCPLCEGAGGHVVFEGTKFRVIRCEEAGIAAFYRVVWAEHVPEFSGLSVGDRRLCMDAVTCVEECLRRHLAPDKVNLAALGNAVPHLHWHVIARFSWDSYFPGSVWSTRLRDAPQAELASIAGRVAALEEDLVSRLAAPDR